MSEEKKTMLSEHHNRAHAVLSASASSRWLACTPSIRLSEQIYRLKETTDYAESILQQKSEGYEQDSNPILFDKKRLLDNLKSIRYLYGQLLTTHKHTNTINTNVNGKTNVMTNYMGNTWITNKGILLQFFHLGVGSDTIYPFSLNGNSMFRNVGITPTLSPKDPAFPAWWEAHKSEWEA